jgi:3,4-dihydroxy 2-butanone 4-phosphate synthase/GTP cyclohydrolase II
LADLLSIAAQTDLPTPYGTFRLVGFSSEHLALVMGHLTGAGPVLTRLHSECLTGEVFGSLRCDCAAQLQLALQEIAARQQGVLVYLRQEGRGIGLLNKIRAYSLQDGGKDTVEANHALGFAEDQRDYAEAAAILRLLGVERVELMTNNPRKVAALQALGMQVVRRVPLEVGHHDANRAYLETKRDKLGHLLGTL